MPFVQHQSINDEEYRKLYNSHTTIAVPSACDQCNKEEVPGGGLCKFISESAIPLLWLQGSPSNADGVYDDQQLDAWKGVGLTLKTQYNHKQMCAWYKKSMEQWPQIRSIQKLFPWSATAKSPKEMPWVLQQLERLLRLNGERAADLYAACMTTTPSGRRRQRTSATGAALQQNVTYESMLLEQHLPPHIQAWRIPTNQIPHLSFELEPDSKSKIPGLHDNNFVQDWATWYTWRKLERESPVALRMDVVLTVYHLLTKVLGVVDTAQAATKTRRKLTVHYVGTEKELNIIPLFSELALLLPNTDIEMPFLAPLAKEKYPRSLAVKSTVFEYTAPPPLGASTLRVKIYPSSDSYGLKSVGSGGTKPDALIAENAGLFAYMTWQIVYSHAARAGIPWGVTEYQMSEALQYQAHMWQWRDLAVMGCRMTLNLPGGNADELAKTELEEEKVVGGLRHPGRVSISSCAPG
ncbi:hypothetical protein DFH07DRAFT_990154 [Mycena maculata]|uniref:Mitochondrial splicing suppressor 51-like C-terminal domain-containing protein n=1 Tax=Mycena maculata TaxID=230809 RepID=A0AAD7JWY5_9AGAR|nr:hypothetical protein DFH07DRAFT_990154 [Mycena maculata]